MSTKIREARYEGAGSRMTTALVERLWRRLANVLTAFEHKVAASNPKLVHKLERASNAAFALRAYLSFRRSACSDELAITVDVRADNRRLTIESDACTDGGEIIADGPSVSIALSDGEAAVGAVDEWLTEFECFLQENERQLVNKIQRLARRNEDFYAHLRKLLLIATSNAFDAAVAIAAPSPLYAFGLEVDGEGAGILAVASSDASLAMAAAKYARHDMYSSVPPEQLGVMLRWSIGDWPIRRDVELEAAMKAVNELLLTAWNEESGEWDIDEATVAEVCLQVLRELDARGTFGRGKQRDSLVLVRPLHDESDESFLRTVAELNSQQAVSRVAAEREAGSRIAPTL